MIALRDNPGDVFRFPEIPGVGDGDRGDAAGAKADLYDAKWQQAGNGVG